MQVEKLIHRLVRDEHYGLAVYVTKRWSLDEKHVWESWAAQSIR